MAQIMESWFLADVAALKSFYGKEFKETQIPKVSNVETIAKETVEKALETATAKTSKEKYHKIEHGAKLLELINPQTVRNAAKHCDELFEILEEKIGK